MKVRASLSTMNKSKLVGARDNDLLLILSEGYCVFHRLFSKIVGVITLARVLLPEA